MKIVPTQQVAGHAVGETADVDNEYGHWLVANGYATVAEPITEPASAQPRSARRSTTPRSGSSA